MKNPSKDSPLSVRSGHRVDVEVELHSYTRSNQVDFPLLFFVYTDLTYLQVDSEIKVAEEEQDPKEAETRVQKYKSFILPIICSFRFNASSEK